MTVFKVGDSVILNPPYGPHVGKRAIVTKIHETLDNSEWYEVEIEGERLSGPLQWLREGSP